MTMRTQQLFKALQKLHKALADFDKSTGSDLYESMRNSLIKYFEFFYELLWKSLKDHLLETHDVATASPRATFVECYNRTLISKEQYEALMETLNDRNNTTHAYNEALAEHIAHNIKTHYKNMLSLALHFFNADQTDTNLTI